MNKKSVVFTSIVVLITILVAISLPIFAQDSNEEEVYMQTDEDSNWTVIKAKDRIIQIKNQSSEKIFVIWDNYPESIKDTEEEKAYLKSVILPKEDFIMPRCKTIYLKVSVHRVKKEDNTTIIITD